MPSAVLRFQWNSMAVNCKF